MKDNYLDVRCSCGGHRVIYIGQLAENQHLAHLTLADVALKLSCHRCRHWPDAVYLTATVYGIGPPPYGGGGLVWIIPLLDRTGPGSEERRVPPAAWIPDSYSSPPVDKVS
jgi:hypothetical protein